MWLLSAPAPRVECPYEPHSYADVDENGLRVGAWGAPFCACLRHAVPNCFMVTFCPCVAVAQISSRLGLDSFFKTLVFFAILVPVEVACGFKLAMSYQHCWSTRHIASYDGAYAMDGSGSDASVLSVVIAHNRWSILSAIFPFLFMLYVFRLRTHIRRRFQIPGNALNDCAVSCCCYCCAVAQMASHVKSYQRGRCSFTRVDKLPPYPAW